MAGVATQSSEQIVNVTLRVLVDKERKKVVYAEAEKDFVDVLLSFLTLPLGTIARLVSKESNIEAVKFDSISSLYQSVSDLKEEYLWNKACKEMLLKPRNSMEAYCQQLKLNIDETQPLQYLCKSIVCREFVNNASIFCNLKCKCGMLFDSDYPVVINDMTCVGDGFVKETASFIIRDDLYMMPNHLGTSVCLLKKHGINDLANTEKKTLVITKKEVVDLLKLSLLSKTPLTDFIFKNKNFLCNSNPTLQSKIRIAKDLPSDSDEAKQNMVVKLMLRKSNTKVLFATAEEDFADFLFSFLTFPLGAVLQLLDGLSSLSSIDGLYRSMTELSSERYLRSQDLKNKLSSLGIFPTFQLRNQILPIGTSELCYKLKGKLLEYVDPKPTVSVGYVRGPLTIMVTDDLIVTPISSIDVVSYLEKMKVPVDDLEEMVISIGVKEGLSILKASLATTCALTNGLKPYIGRLVQANLTSNASPLKKPKVEK